LFAGLSEDAVAEEEMKVGKELSEAIKSNWWLLPYLVMLLPAFALAVAGPVLALTQPKFPPVVEKLLHYRPVILAGLAIFTMIFIAAQWSRGFSLERAVREKVEAQFAEEKAKVKTPEQEKRWEMKYGKEWNAWSVQTTTALRFAFLLHLLAAFAVATEAGLQLRGKKAPPRIGVMW
jgi:hypothetical protein